MTGEELFQIWAPANSAWSQWVSPILFAQIRCEDTSNSGFVSPPAGKWVSVEFEQGTAIIIDLPGPESIALGIALARRGFRPVPIFNSTAGPMISPAGNANTILDVSGIQREICAESPALKELSLPADSPPAFLLDASRLTGHRPVSRDLFDNRSILFLEDFPSAKFLDAHAIRRVILIQEGGAQPQQDLASVLGRWQNEGVEVLLQTRSDALARKIKVAKLSFFRSLWDKLTSRLSLPADDVGGFGSGSPNSWVGWG